MASSFESKELQSLRSVHVEDLRLGMYIHLNCSWFLHPFSRQHFQLTSESQIITIRGLGLSSILLDPSRSTPKSLEQIHRAPTSDTGMGSVSAHTRGSTSPIEYPQPVRPTTLPAADTLRSGESEEKFRDTLQQAARTYEDAARHFKEAVGGLHAGSENGMAAAKAVTNQLAHVLFDDELAGSIVGLLDAPVMEERDILHALNVSVLAMMVGQQFALSAEDIKILGIGALLHDIGEQQIPRDVYARRARMSPDEGWVYREHPSRGVKLLSALSSFPHEALRMIESHHERIDGSGYPDQLQEEYLSVFTKILMVVDEYDLLINHEDLQQRMTQAEALSHLYRTARTTLPSDVIAALIQTLTVYPPGTIVELVNGAYAMVLTINRQARMKPLVLLYIAHQESRAPVIIDLMRDRTRSIAHRPPLSGVPPRIRAYLNMQRWMPYFLSAAAKGSSFSQ
jgi:HD-GYP domain-containing protein (c-di-GMP phosphodiesterase class II)